MDQFDQISEWIIANWNNVAESIVALLFSYLLLLAPLNLGSGTRLKQQKAPRGPYVTVCIPQICL